jgi:hypothetical protein
MLKLKSLFKKSLLKQWSQRGKISLFGVRGDISTGCEACILFILI